MYVIYLEEKEADNKRASRGTDRGVYILDRRQGGSSTSYT